MHKSSLCNRRPRQVDVSVRGSHMSTREVAGNREILDISAAFLSWRISNEQHYGQCWMPVMLAAVVQCQPKDVKDSAWHGTSISSGEVTFHHAAMPSWQMCLRLVSSQFHAAWPCFLRPHVVIVSHSETSWMFQQFLRRQQFWDLVWALYSS